MRIAYLIICMSFVGLGALFGALNPQTVLVDFYLAGLELRLGVGLLLAGLTGALLGGLCVWAGVVVPLRRRLGRQQRANAALEGAGLPARLDESPL